MYKTALRSHQKNSIRSGNLARPSSPSSPPLRIGQSTPSFSHYSQLESIPSQSNNRNQQNNRIYMPPTAEEINQSFIALQRAHAAPREHPPSSPQPSPQPPPPLPMAIEGSILDFDINLLESVQYENPVPLDRGFLSAWQGMHPAALDGFPPAAAAVAPPLQVPPVLPVPQLPPVAPPIALPIPPRSIINIPWNEMSLIAGVKNSSNTYPHSLVPGVRQLNINLMTAIESGFLHHDDVAVDMAIKKLLLIPTALLTRGSTHKSELAHQKLVLQQMLNDDWSAITEDKLIRKRVYRRNPADERPDAMSQSQKRAMHYMDKGLVGKAYDALRPCTPASLSLGTFERLKNLHLPRQPADDFHFDDVPLVRVTFTPDALMAKIRSTKDLIVPGISKTRAEHFKQLAGASGDLAGEDYVRHLCIFLQRIVNGKMSEQVLAFMRSGILIALSKTDDPDGPVRPITLAEDYRKLAASMLAPVATQASLEKFGDIQTGVGTPYGTEIVSHDTVTAMEKNPSDDNAIVDNYSAFNTFKRKAAWGTIKVDHPMIVPYFKDFYGVKSSLYVNMGNAQNMSIIHSEEGGFQGDPTMPLIYCATLQPLLVSMTAETPGAKIKAYMDDVRIRGNTESVSTALRHYIRDGPAIGSLLNVTKTKVLLGIKDSPEEAQAAYTVYRELLGPLLEGQPENILIHPSNLSDIEVQQAQRVRYGACVVGTPVGSSEYKAAWLQKKLVELTEEAELLIALPDVQSRWVLFFQCFQAKVNHLLRVLPLIDLELFLTQYEALKRRILSSIVGVELSDFQWEQATMPLGVGGFGLVDSRLIAPAAYFASRVAVKSKLSFTAEELLTVPSWITMMTTLGERFKDIVPDINDSQLIAKGLQKRLTAPIKYQLSQAFKDKTNRFRPGVSPMQLMLDKIRLVSLRGGSVSAGFLQVVPKGRVFMQLAPRRFSTACCMRLGADMPIIPEGLCCTSAVHRNRVDIDRLGIHLSNCTSLNGYNTKRHNSLVYLIRQMADSAGIINEKEPECLGGDHRADIRLRNDRGEGFTGTKDLLLDVTVANPCAPTNIELDVWRETGGLASAAYTEKITKYQPVVDAYGFDFKPVVFETFGGVHGSTLGLIKMFADRISRRSGIPLPAIKRFWLQRFSVLLQDWNAWTIESRLSVLCQHRANGGNGRGGFREEEQYNDRIYGVVANAAGGDSGD